MSRATSFLRYKTANVSGSIEAAGLGFAITSSIISGSYGIPWFSSINPTGNQIVIVSNTPYQIGDLTTIYNPVFYVVNNTTEDLVGTAASNPTYTGSLNRLKGITTRYTTTASALTAIVNDFLGQTQPEYSVVNFAYPSIPTRGLVGLFDAGFYSSYPKSSIKIWSIAGDLYTQNGIPRSGSINGIDVGLSYIPRGNSGSLLLDNTTGTNNLHIELSNLTPAYGPNGSTRYVRANGGTIAIWCKPTASVANTDTTQMAILSNSGSDDGSGGYGFQMYLNGGTFISALAGQNSNPNDALIVNNDVPVGGSNSITTEAMFLAVTWNGSTTSGYFGQKGNDDGGKPFQIQYTPSSYPTENNQIVYINRMGPGGNTNMYGKGIEFYAAYFYNTALTQDEINSLYNARIFQ